MPRLVRDYKDEYAKYQGKPDQIKNRAQRNTARAEATKTHGAAALKGKDVDHKKPISKGGGNGKGNTRVTTVKANRSFARNSRGGIK